MHAYLGSHFTETVILAGIENIHLNSDVGEVYDNTNNGFEAFAKTTGLTINFKAHTTDFNVPKSPRVGLITKTSLFNGFWCFCCPLQCNNQT